MILRDYITASRSEAPWVQDFQVEQDLIISKALVDIFFEPVLRSIPGLASRTGNKPKDASRSITGLTPKIRRLSLLNSRSRSIRASISRFTGSNRCRSPYHRAGLRQSRPRYGSSEGAAVSAL